MKLMLCKRESIGRGQCSEHVWESKYSMFDPQRPTYKTCSTPVINIVKGIKGGILSLGGGLLQAKGNLIASKGAFLASLGESLKGGNGGNGGK